LPVLAAATISSAASLHMSRPVRDDWEAAAIPAGLRGRYLGRRVRLLSLVAVAALVAPAILGDAAGRNPTVLAGLLVVGGAFGVLAVASLSRVAQYGGEGFSDIAMKDVLAVAKVSSFRRFVGGTFIYNLPFLLTVPFYQVYFQTVLGMSFSVIVGNSAAYLLLKAAAARAIGSLGDRLGPRRGLLVVGPLYITFFVLMALSTPDRVWLVYLAWGTAAVGDAMYMVAYTSGLYAAVPKRGPRPAFFAFNNLFVLGAYGVGAIVAELLIKWMGDGERMIGPMSFGPYQCLYLIAGATMCVAMFGALLYVRKPARMRHHPTPGGQKNITV